MQLLSAFLALATIVTSTLATPIEIVERSFIPPKDKVFIKSVKFAGSGCPAGSVQASLGDDLSNVKLLFSKYIAQIGPGILPVDWRKNCAINVNVQFPEGYTYTIFSTEYEGYVHLDPKVKATQKSDYSFTGYPPKMTFQSDWIGPYDNDYYFYDDIPTKSYIYSPCGYKATLNINTQIRLDNAKNATGSGLITTDAIGHKVTHKYHLSWKKCPK